MYRRPDQTYNIKPYTWGIYCCIRYKFIFGQFQCKLWQFKIYCLKLTALLKWRERIRLLYVKIVRATTLPSQSNSWKLKMPKIVNGKFYGLLAPNNTHTSCSKTKQKEYKNTSRNVNKNYQVWYPLTNIVYCDWHKTSMSK